MRYVENKKRVKEETVDVRGDMDNLIFGLTDFLGEGTEKYRQVDWKLSGTYDTLSLDKPAGTLKVVKDGVTKVGMPVEAIRRIDYTSKVCLFRVSSKGNMDILVSIEK